MNKLKLKIGLFVALVLSLSHFAGAQDVPYTSAANTLSTNAVAANATTTVTSDTVRVRGNQGVAFLPSFALAGTGTNTVTFNFNVSYDGSTWTTTTPFTYAMVANGTNTVRGFANFGPATSTSLNNVRYIRLGSITVNSASTNNVTGIALRYSYFNK
jgi:hypothetical protein